MSRVDARLRETQFLARLDREGSIALQDAYSGNADEQMIISLLHDGYLNDGFDELRTLDPSAWQSMLERHSWVRGQQIGAVLKGRPFSLKISHKGRVRLSELEQQLKAGRDRDDTGILLAKRHLELGLGVDVLSASKETPLSVAFLDMNGLTGINKHGHAAGDEALRAFFQAVVATLGKQGEAYRYGGDEVVVVLRDTDDESAQKLLDAFVRQLGKDPMKLGDAKEIALTASCGSVSTTNPREDAKELLKRADGVLLRAKPMSGPGKVYEGRVSAFAVGDGEVITYAPG